MADLVLTMIHECKDFAHWKKVYDADAPNRRGAGLTDLALVRLSTNSNVIALVFKVSDEAKAKALASSPAMLEKMRSAGIIGTPELHYRRGDFTQRDVTTYLSLNCRISSLDKFRKGYAMDKTDRKAAGLTDIAVLVDVDDENDLLLLWSVEDVARADKFLSSPGMAEHQVKNAGVISPPVLRYWKSA